MNGTINRCTRVPLLRHRSSVMTTVPTCAIEWNVRLAPWSRKQIHTSAHSHLCYLLFLPPSNSSTSDPASGIAESPVIETYRPFKPHKPTPLVPLTRATAATPSRCEGSLPPVALCFFSSDPSFHRLPTASYCAHARSTAQYVALSIYNCHSLRVCMSVPVYCRSRPGTAQSACAWLSRRCFNYRIV